MKKMHLQLRNLYLKFLLICITFFNFRFIATGDLLRTISFSYHLGHSTVYQIVTDIYKVIVER
jgi:hypothetical protein